MPNIVTFDTTRLLIIEIPVHASPMTSPQTLLDNVTSMQEIYSEWKEFVAKTAGSPASGGLGFPPAIRQVAGDPITDTQNLGITYFVTNGWRFKPAEGNHKWTVDGNVWTDPPGQSVFVATDGPFTVNTETKVSNLVDGLTNINTTTAATNALVEDIHGQVRRSVFIDPAVSPSGTDGYQQSPFNDLTDAIDYAEANNLQSLVLLGDITLDRTLKNFIIQGVGNPAFDFNGFTVTGCDFSDVELDGTIGAGSTMHGHNCKLRNNLSGINGTFTNCGFDGDLFFAPGSQLDMIDCYSSIGGLGRPTGTISGGGSPAANVSIRGFKGGFTWKGTAGGDEVTISMASGKLTLDSSNVGGTISVRGLSQFTNKANGSVVDSTGLLNTEEVDLAAALIAGDAVVSSDDLTVTIFESESPIPSPRTVKAVYSVSADGRIRNRLI